MESIATAAGVSRTALYYYFPSKAELVREVMGRLDWRGWWTRTIAAGWKGSTFAERLKILLSECVTESLERDGSVYFALLDAAREDVEVRAVIRAELESVRSELLTLVADCKRKKYIPRHIDGDLLADGILGLIWCVAAGLMHASTDTVVREVISGIDIACRRWDS
jgi:AcrR family transcriptional regulator